MYLPRSLISKLYSHLQNTRHPLSPPVLILVALEPDALCACRILTRLLKHDYIPHKIQPVAGYNDLEKAGRELVVPMMESQGGSGGVVVCLGVGGMVDLGPLLGLEPEGEESPYSGVEVWVLDAHRPWNLANVFGGFPLEPVNQVSSSYKSRSPTGVSGGAIDRAYSSGRGGIVVFDDGDIEGDLMTERDAYLALLDMPDIEGQDNDDDDNSSEDGDEEDDGDFGHESAQTGQKRKSLNEDDSSDDEESRPRQRRRSNSTYTQSSSIVGSPTRPEPRGLLSIRNPGSILSSDPIEPPSGAQPLPAASARTLRKRLLRMRRENETVLQQYYKMGSSFAEPISSMMYSLASELGRDDNDLLWLAIVGVTSMELLKTWSESGIKRLHKLLAKMGVSLAQCKQSYTHMDMVLKRELRAKLLKYGSLYNLDEMVPSVDTDGKDRAGAKDGWGFVRSWGWRATLSAQDVGVVIGALLEVGKHAQALEAANPGPSQVTREMEDESELAAQGEEWISRFWEAYDALEDIDALKAGLPTAQFLHRAIYRTGTSLINKKQIKHLRAFRMCVVKDGPDVALFTHPAALTKLALWIGEALAEQEKESQGKLSHGGRGTPLVVASLNEKRGVYIVVGTGGGGGPDTVFVNRATKQERQANKDVKAKKKEEARKAKEKIKEEKRAARRAANQGNDDNGDDDDDELETESEGSESSESEDDSDDEDAENDRGYGLNKFGNAFQEVVSETSARVRIDSFEHSVVEVKKEDLGGFLESLSMKAVVG
ncbi:cell division control protein 45 homolog [Trichoderma asperellum]|uniref:Cell division control protein 45 homolog n=1 Tax=Trichoderma asperellum TaxID=101201 RepID=A0A6V8QQR5_TRIAP|nr:cell division control protein 45 homolog [Trichoderma asperellum]